MWWRMFLWSLKAIQQHISNSPWATYFEGMKFRACALCYFCVLWVLIWNFRGDSLRSFSAFGKKLCFWAVTVPKNGENLIFFNFYPITYKVITSWILLDLYLRKKLYLLFLTFYIVTNKKYIIFYRNFFCPFLQHMYYIMKIKMCVISYKYQGTYL